MIFGDSKVSLDLVPRFNTPGAYNAYFMPTQEGPYTFHFSGTINDQPVDEKFTSSDSTFSTPEQPRAFPVAYPDVEGMNARLSTVEDKVSVSKSSSDNSGTAMAVGIVGIIVGCLGVGLGGFSLMKKGS